MSSRWRLAAQLRWRVIVMCTLALLPCLAATEGRCQPIDDIKRTKRPLIIGTMRSPPFVMQSDAGTWHGYSIELWQRVAKELALAYEFRGYDYDTDGLATALERGEIDAAVVAWPVTPVGEVRFDYTQPYASSGLVIAARAQAQAGLLTGIFNAFSTKLLVPLFFLISLLLGVGTVLWAMERHRNPQQFSRKALAGIGDGAWWAAVTMTTTGYGDKAPLSAQGRLMAMVWMFASIFLTATFSAMLASSFVVDRLRSEINGPSDLATAKIGVVSGSEGELWAGQHGLTARPYSFVIQAAKALKRGEIDALLHERAILAYMMREFGWTDLKIINSTLAPSTYAIVLPPDSPHKEDLNRAVLRVTYSQDWRAVSRRYLGSNDEAP